MSRASLPILRKIVPTSAITLTRTTANSLQLLAEYFFKSPELLKQKDPQLYGMLQEIFHQDTASLLKQTFARRSRYDPNAPCPCRSGKKFKICCRLKGAKRGAAKASETQSPTLAKKREN